MLLRSSFALSAILALVPAQPAGAQAHPASHTMPMIVGPVGIPLSRMGSGTSWLPDSSPMHAVHAMWGGWTAMLHGVVFPQYDYQRGLRGDKQLGLTDWEMLMAMRPAAGGLLHLHAMTSIEALTIGARGYPLLLQTGESYRGFTLYDRQHPHDLFMEIAAMYERQVAPKVAANVYVAAVGEPALGPVAFMHRPSAQSDPLAPLGHHWQDASHESFGVITAGVYTHVVKLEGSVFNAREPDEYRFNFDYRGASLDSYTGRVSFEPHANLVASAWWAYLDDHERLEPGSKMHRMGMSVLTRRGSPFGGDWATGLVVGSNVHHHTGPDHAAAHGDPSATPHHRSTSLLIESNFEIGERNAVFARAETVQKNADELGFLGGDLTQLFDIQSLVGGYFRRLATFGWAEAGAGVRASVSFIPSSLEPTYGTRTPVGMAVYFRLRPRRASATMTMSGM
jgi:hypothetical protein